MNTSIQNNNYEKNDIEHFQAPKNKNEKFKQPSFFLLMLKESMIILILFLLGWLFFSS